MNFKRLVKEGGITDDEKVIRKERGEPGKCNMKLKGRKSFKKETWCGIHVYLQLYSLPCHALFSNECKTGLKNLFKKNIQMNYYTGGTS